MFGLTTTLRRLVLMTVALCAALTMTVMSVAAATPPRSPFATAGCDEGNYSCLRANGAGYPRGIDANGGDRRVLPGYGAANPGVSSGIAYTNVYYQNDSSATWPGYAANYNFNYRYYGIPDSYFTNNGCAVGNYTCLFGKFGSGATAPASFFAAVGCATGDYGCATDQSVFTNVGCTVGNYTCVYAKIGKTP